MINPFTHVNWKPDTIAIRSFARSLVIGFPVVALIFFFASRMLHGVWDQSFPLKLGIGGIIAGLLFWAIPTIARPFYLVWYAVSCTIGLVVSNTLLSVFYYTFFTVGGFLRRTLGKSPLQLDLDRSAPTYWQDIKPVEDPKSYFAQY